MLLPCILNSNPSYSRFEFVLSVIRRINYFVLNEAKSFVLLYHRVPTNLLVVVYLKLLRLNKRKEINHDIYIAL